MRAQLPMLVKAWFVLDLFIVLFPPLHWMASGADPVLGLPRSLLYLAAVCAFIASSVVVAYFADRRSLFAETEGARTVAGWIGET